jgi:hypothetical protein
VHEVPKHSSKARKRRRWHRSIFGTTFLKTAYCFIKQISLTILRILSTSTSCGLTTKTECRSFVGQTYRWPTATITTAAIMTDVDEPAESSSKTPSTTTTTISDDSSDHDDSAWLSSEPHNNRIDEERIKIREILSQITPEERAEIERVDTSIPIRHLRANKVSECSALFVWA